MTSSLQVSQPSVCLSEFIAKKMSQTQQALSSGLLAFFTCDEVLMLLKLERNCQKPLMAMCKTYLSSMEEASATMAALRRAPEMNGIAEAADKIARWCKCFVHIFAEVVDGVPTDYKDVLAFFNYNGKGLFERMLMKQLTQPETFWSAASNEIVRCAGKHALLAPQIEELKAALESDSEMLKCDTLNRCLVLFKNIEEGSRQLEVEPLQEKLQKKLCNIGRKVLEMQPGQVECALVDTLLAALNRFSKIAGSLSMAKELQQWLYANRGVMAMSSFAQTMMDSEVGKVDYPQIAALMVKISETHPTPPPEMQPILEEFLLTVCHDLLNKAG